MQKIIAFIKRAQEVAKLIVGIVTLVSVQLAALIPVDWNVYIQLAISLLGAFAIWRIPNAEPYVKPYGEGEGLFE
jgi:hypothetical protein